MLNVLNSDYTVKMFFINGITYLTNGKISGIWSNKLPR